MPSPPEAAAAALPLPVAHVGTRAQIACWWALSRVAVIATALVVHTLRRPKGFFDPQVAHQPLGLLAIWDGAWYRRVAEHGYLLISHHQSDPAFFPLYPILLRLAHPLGLSYTTFGVIVSNLALLGALVVFYELGRLLLPEEVAYRAVAFVAVFPLGYVFSMVYPESLVLAAIAGAVLLGLRRRWLAAGAALAIATLARPEGLFAAIPLAAIVVQRWHSLEPAERGRAVAAVAAGPAALAAFLLYLGWVLHDPLAWNRSQAAWGRSFRIDGVVRAVNALPGTHHPWLYRDVAFFVVYLLLIAAAGRAGVGWSWLAMALLIVVLPITSGSFESVGRFGLLALPVYWGLASVARNRWAAGLLQVASLALLVAGTVSLKFAFP